MAKDRQQRCIHCDKYVFAASEGLKKRSKKPSTESTERGGNMTLSKQHSSSQLETLFWFVMTFCAGFLTGYPVVSLWKPGVPYPVHGRVLVEIQRPRSLHRKAVIQLNTKRNQHSQSKPQFICTQKHHKTQTSLRESNLP